MFTFLHQTDKFIITGDMAPQTFWQWSDDIKPKDDITPFDGTFGIYIYIIHIFIIHKKKSPNSRYQGFTYYFSKMEGSGT